MRFLDQSFNQGHYYVVVTQADGNKIFTSPIRYTRDDAAVAAPSGPLPLTLTSFRAGVRGEATAVLSWATAQEENNSHFDVERSADGRTFQAIGRVAASGRSGPGSYELADPTPLTARAYYRLRQVDRDGAFAFSPVTSVSPADREPAQLAVYPNPSPGGYALRWPCAATGPRPPRCA